MATLPYTTTMTGDGLWHWVYHIVAPPQRDRTCGENTWTTWGNQSETSQKHMGTFLDTLFVIFLEVAIHWVHELEVFIHLSSVALGLNMDQNRCDLIWYYMILYVYIYTLLYTVYISLYCDCYIYIYWYIYKYDEWYTHFLQVFNHSTHHFMEI